MTSAKRAKLAWVLVAVSAGMGAALLNAEAETGTPPSPGVSPASTGSPVSAKPEAAAAPVTRSASSDERGGGCLVDPAAIEDLRQRRVEVDVKSKDLLARESELKGRERALDEEFKKLEDLRIRIEKAQGSLKKDNEEKVAKLVETLETMNPKSAAALMTTLDDSLAVVAMTRLATPKLAKIMNLLDPGRSAQLTEAMTGYLNPTKGGKHVGPQAAAQPNQPAPAGT